MISDKFKHFIFDQLYKELGDCEIIPYNDSIWIINRENKRWYFELDGKGCLWWMGPFFYKYFRFFSLEIPEFLPVIVEWVEEVLNCKIVKNYLDANLRAGSMDEVLTCNVATTGTTGSLYPALVDEILKYKVVTTEKDKYVRPKIVELILNRKDV